ncbi:RNA polymerase sigma-70 domain protein, partial [mine drainage metagenome]
MPMTAASALHERATSSARPTPQSSHPPAPAVSASALSGVDQRQRRGLLRFLTRRTGSAEEAEDILQDAYTRILAVVHPGEIDMLDRYLWRAALNVMTDHSRTRQRRALLTETLIVQAEQFSPSAEVVADAQERLALTGAAVNALPPRCAEAFQLRIVQGLPFEDVGQAMHISARMAKIYVARTLRALRDGLDGTRVPAVPARPTRPRAPVRPQHATVPPHPARVPTPPAPTAPHAPL